MIEVLRRDRLPATFAKHFYGTVLDRALAQSVRHLFKIASDEITFEDLSIGRGRSS